MDLSSHLLWVPLRGPRSGVKGHAQALISFSMNTNMEKALPGTL